MSNHSRILRSWPALAMIGWLALPAVAKTDSAIVQQFADLLGGGTFARIVWTKGDTNQWSNLEDYGKVYDTKIYACDSRNGIRRPLSDALPYGHLVNATFTPDGARVIFSRGETKEVYICDFRGTNLRKLYSGGLSFRTWRDPSLQSDWVIISSDTGVIRLNIDAPNITVPLLTKPYIVGNDPTRQTVLANYLSLSINGEYLLGGFPTYAGVGVMPVPDGIVRYFTLNGCWPSFSKVTPNRIMYTIEPHTSIRIVDMEENEILRKNIATNVLPGGYYNALRWSNDDDIISHWNGGPVRGRPVVRHMPIVQRVSNLKWVSIYDSATDFNANADVFVYAGAIADSSTGEIDTSSVDTTGTNEPPRVRAGNDTTYTQSRTTTFFLKAAITDDRKRLRQPQVTWSQLSGPTAVIASPATQYTSVLFPIEGDYAFEVGVFDGEYTAKDTVAVTVSGGSPLRLIAPAGGEKISIGGVFKVVWEIDPPQGLVIHVSTDAGLNWHEITPQAVGMALPLQYYWVVDTALGLSDSCLLRVESYVLRDRLSVTSELFSLVAGSGAARPRAGLRDTGGEEIRVGATTLRFEGQSRSLAVLYLIDRTGRCAAKYPVVNGAAQTGGRRIAPGVYWAELRTADGERYRRGCVLAR